MWCRLCFFACLVSTAWVLSSCTEPNPGHPDGASAPDLGIELDLPPIDDAGHTCVPDEFIACMMPARLVKCDSTGTSVISISCLPYPCNLTTGSCYECNPADPPRCVDGSVEQCTPEGELVVTPCADGCENGSCTGTCTETPFFKDGDGDGHGDPQARQDSCEQPPGYVPAGDDCNDSDNRAYPGQTGWFTGPSTGTYSFDFDCSGAEEKKHTTMVNCVYQSGTCTGDGWSNFIPDCGHWGFYAVCEKSNLPGGSACKMTWSNLQQPCH